MQWPVWNDFGLSPAPCGSACPSQTPFRSAVTGKFAGRLSHFTILPSQTIASGQAWWRGCMIHFKVPVGHFLGTNSMGTQSFWNSTHQKHPDCTALFFSGGCLSEKVIHFWVALPHVDTETCRQPHCKGSECGLKPVFQEQLPDGFSWLCCVTKDTLHSDPTREDHYGEATRVVAGFQAKLLPCWLFYQWSRSLLPIRPTGVLPLEFLLTN